MLNSSLATCRILTYQFSSVHFDLITQEMLHLQLIGGFHAGPGPHRGDGDDIITDIVVSVNKGFQ